MNGRTRDLIQDMLDTMYEEMGVGLAAPQVGILKRIVVIDVGDGPHILINPQIVETSGEQCGTEGVPEPSGKGGAGDQTHVCKKAKALDENMEPYVLEGEGLLARAICHECEHLDGILFVEHVEGELMDMAAMEEEEEE